MKQPRRCGHLIFQLLEETCDLQVQTVYKFIPTRAKLPTTNPTVHMGLTKYVHVLCWCVREFFALFWLIKLCHYNRHLLCCVVAYFPVLCFVMISTNYVVELWPALYGKNAHSFDDSSTGEIPPVGEANHNGKRKSLRQYMSRSANF